MITKFINGIFNWKKWRKKQANARFKMPQCTIIAMSNKFSSKFPSIQSKIKRSVQWQQQNKWLSYSFFLNRHQRKFLLGIVCKVVLGPLTEPHTCPVRSRPRDEALGSGLMSTPTASISTQLTWWLADAPGESTVTAPGMDTWSFSAQWATKRSPQERDWVKVSL